MAQELKTTEWFTNSNLKAYYRFENGALTTDSSGNSHTLSAISDPAEDTSGKLGSAIALDGNDAYSAVNHADFRPTGAFTIGGWVKTSASGSSQYIFQSWKVVTNVYYGFLILVSVAGKFQFISAKGTGNVAGTDYGTITGGTSVNDGNWNFVVATWDTSNLRVYVNGASDATAVTWANAPSYGSGTVYQRIGCRNDDNVTNELFLTGSLDDVFLINGTALSANQIKQIYEGSTFFQMF